MSSWNHVSVHLLYLKGRQNSGTNFRSRVVLNFPPNRCQFLNRALLVQKGDTTRGRILGHVLVLTSYPIDVKFEQSIRAIFVQRGRQNSGTNFRSRVFFTSHPIDVKFEQCLSACFLYQNGDKSREAILGHVLFFKIPSY